MKILITENQLEKVIDNYINKLLKDLHENSLSSAEWINKNGELKIYLCDSGTLTVSEDYWYDVQNVLGLKYIDVVNSFMRWAERNDYHPNFARVTTLL